MKSFILGCFIFVILLSCKEIDKDFHTSISKLDSNLIALRLKNTSGRDLYISIDKSSKITNYELKYNYKNNDGWEELKRESFVCKEVVKLENDDYADVEFVMLLKNIDTLYLNLLYFIDSVPSLESERRANIQVLPADSD